MDDAKPCKVKSMANVFCYWLFVIAVYLIAACGFALADWILRAKPQAANNE
jgi:hypothetical protein